MLRIVFVLGFAFLLSFAGATFAAPPTPPPIEAYGRLPAIDMVKLSPAGDRYAAIGVVGGVRRILVATTDDQPLDFINIGDAKIRNIEWAGEDHVLVFSSATVELGPDFRLSKNEMSAVHVLDVHGRKNFAVFGEGHNHHVANAVFGFYGTAELEGHWYGYFGAITYEQNAGATHLGTAFTDLYKVDLDTGDLKMAARGSFGVVGWLVSPTGEIVATSYYEKKTSFWRVVGGAGDGITLASGHDDFHGAGNLHFGRNYDEILFAIPDETNGAIYQEFSLKGAQVSSEPIGTHPIFDPTTRLWIGYQDIADHHKITFFSPVLQARANGTAKAFPGYEVYIESYVSDLSRLITLTEGGNDAGTYFLVDIAKHAADPLAERYPEIRPKNVGPVRMIDWAAQDGLRIQGVLTLPPGRDPKGLPIVVLPHGGPEARDTVKFDWWAQAFASQGYAVLQPNFRGSSGYGEAFRNAGFGEWGRKMQTDISDGVTVLAKAGTIDPKRACIVGDSYGGYAALAGVTVQHGLYRCAVSVSGVSDLSDILHYTGREEFSDSAARYWKTFMGVKSTWGNELDDITPTMLADRADAPILLIHGKNDTVVPIRQSEEMERALKRAGKPVEFITMDGEDHWLSREDTRITMLKSAVAFVEKYNPAN